jgi:hypothetical protein
MKAENPDADWKKIAAQVSARINAKVSVSARIKAKVSDRCCKLEWNEIQCGNVPA